FQVMRLLTDKAVDTKRAALMLYALQIASSNLKRLHEETQEITKSGDIAQEKSLMKELLEVLHLPETEYERLAEEMAVEEERQNGSSVTHTIKACASDHAESPTPDHHSHRFDINACVASRKSRARGRASWRKHKSTRVSAYATSCGPKPEACSLKPCASSTFVPFVAQKPLNASKSPCYTFSSSR
ncbi:MAG: hypothetical protein WCC59_02605, partial [Terriglobales bacterium]